MVLIIFFYFFNSLFAQTWSWAKQAKGGGQEDAYGLAIDKTGNTYLTGGWQEFYNDSLIFGNVKITTSATGYGFETFLVKYSPAGTPLWAVTSNSIRNTGTSFGNSVATDAIGNEYVTGHFKGRVNFGANFLTSMAPNVFLTKYNAAGNILWIRTSHVSDSLLPRLENSGTSVATDLANNIYITGTFRDTIYFGTDTLISADTGRAVFLVKYDPNGNVLWATSAGGKKMDESLSVTTDKYNNAYITGFYNSSSISFGPHTLTNAGLRDIFIAKYNAAGNSIWAKSAGG
ncbi:MAG TPA: hypothetical protein VNZ45_03990, partial [Bacteroidia bacterium]|nr:hypothetical protein [Bacteroidia bacterium]